MKTLILVPVAITADALRATSNVLSKIVRRYT